MAFRARGCLCFSYFSLSFLLSFSCFLCSLDLAGAAAGVFIRVVARMQCNHNLYICYKLSSCLFLFLLAIDSLLGFCLVNLANAALALSFLSFSFTLWHSPTLLLSSPSLLHSPPLLLSFSPLLLLLSPLHSLISHLSSPLSHLSSLISHLPLSPSHLSPLSHLPSHSLSKPLTFTFSLWTCTPLSLSLPLIAARHNTYR
ncbi:hypothetical protein DFP73DRAFT_220265 [Morchella snyderi]|nr:hypothetical protein DFP73DRAFT_220265 [Morchella snyderi]